MRTNQKIKIAQRAEQFTSELSALKDYFHIPGLAVSIDKNGGNIYQEYFGNDFTYRVQIELDCPLKLKNYPMDVQSCKISIQSCE